MTDNEPQNPKKQEPKNKQTLLARTKEALGTVGIFTAAVVGTHYARSKYENDRFERIETQVSDDTAKFAPVEFKPVDPAEVGDVLSLARRLKAEGYNGINFGEGNHTCQRQYDIYTSLVKSDDLGINLMFIEGLAAKSDSQEKIATEQGVGKLMDRYESLSPGLNSKQEEFGLVARAKGLGMEPNSKIRAYATDTYDSQHVAELMRSRSSFEKGVERLFPLKVTGKYHLDASTQLRNHHMAEVMIDGVDQALHDRTRPNPFHMSIHGMDHFRHPGDVDEMVSARLNEIGHRFKSANIYILPVGVKDKHLDGKLFRKPGSSEYMIFLHEPTLPIVYDVDKNGKLNQDGIHQSYRVDLKALEKKEYISAIERPHAQYTPRASATPER